MSTTAIMDELPQPGQQQQQQEQEREEAADCDADIGAMDVHIDVEQLPQGLRQLVAQLRKVPPTIQEVDLGGPDQLQGGDYFRMDPPAGAGSLWYRRVRLWVLGLIGSCPSLRVVKLGNCGITSESEVERLCQGLKSNALLQWLTLDGNVGFGSDFGCLHVGRILASSASGTSLEELDMDGVGLRAAGLSQLLSTLLANTEASCLQTLDVENNPECLADERAAELLAQVVLRSKCLRKIRIGNTGLAVAGAALLSTALGAHLEAAREVTSMRDNEDETLEVGFIWLLEAMLRSGEKAADAEELGAAVDWYHKAVEVARVGRTAEHLNLSHLSYRIGELHYLAGAWTMSLEMLSNCLRHVLLAVGDTRIDARTELWTINNTGRPEPPRHVTKAVILVHRLPLQIQSPGRFGERHVGDAWVLQDVDVLVNDIRCMRVVQIQVTLGAALCAVSKPEGIRWLEAARDALLLGMEMDGAELALYDVQICLAQAYSKLAHDSSKAAQMYELCRDMATHLHNRLAMQLDAAREWAHAGDLLTAEEAVLEALDFLVPPAEQSSASASEVTSILWGSATTAESSRFGLLANAAWLVASLWPREQRREHMHAKLKAALQAAWELYCRSLTNNVDDCLITSALLELVDVYQTDEEWAAAEGLLDALAPQLKDSRDFQTREALQLRHTRHYLQAAGVFRDLLLSSASEDSIDDATGTVPAIYHDDATRFSPIFHAQLMLSTALDYGRVGQHQLAARMLDRLERMIRATTSWPRLNPFTNDVDPKQNLELKLCLARVAIAEETGRSDEGVMWLHKAASLQEAIINDIQQQQQQLPLAKHLVRRALVSALTTQAHIYHVLNKDDVKGLEAKIERIQTLDPDMDAGKVYMRELRLRLLLAKGDREEAVELMRELFLLMAERQEGGGGGDDDNWIRGYKQGGNYMNLAEMVELLQGIHIHLGRYDKALLWAERGRMRLFMHRVHAQEDDPESAMDSTPNDFDRDDGKALDMLLNTLLAYGPNVVLLEYSVSEANSRGLRALHIYCLSRDPVAGGPARTLCYVRVVPDCRGIEQLVNKARDSIIATPAAGKQHRLALAKLHSLLVAPVLKELPDHCDTLIFVPDGCLSLVPFAALYDESAGQFLIQQKQVVVAPCLRALHRCLDLQHRFFSTASTLQQPFVAGNPYPMGLGLLQLPHAEEEAAAVADILGVEPCLGAAVTKEAVVEALCHSSVVVLASHAIFGPNFPAGALVLKGPSSTHDPDMASSSSRANYDPALLRAVMMDPDSDEPELEAALLMRGLRMQASVTDKSQVLTADELSGMRIRAGLVVLSACETGRGEVTPEGVLGLGRALLQAGAATTVLSLWKVDDQATKRLITEMFQELQKGEPVWTALRKAMLKMIQEGSSISQWAPFFIFGSPTMVLRSKAMLNMIQELKMIKEGLVDQPGGRGHWAPTDRITIKPGAQSMGKGEPSMGGPV